jgi:hypothetical protein
MRNYHVVLEDGTERNIRAEDHELRDRVLSFTRGDEEVVVYNQNAWKLVEVESQDDRGE